MVAAFTGSELIALMHYENHVDVKFQTNVVEIQKASFAFSGAAPGCKSVCHFFLYKSIASLQYLKERVVRVLVPSVNCDSLSFITYYNIMYLISFPSKSSDI